MAGGLVLSALALAGAFQAARAPELVARSLLPFAPGAAGLAGTPLATPVPPAAEKPAPTPFDDIIREAAAKYGVDPDLVRAVVRTESEFDPRARSAAGAEGLMQLMPVLQRELGVRHPFDPRENIFGGVKYLSRLLERHEGNVDLALASYNAGPRNVARYRGVPPFKETRGYVHKIQGLLDAADAAGGATGAAD
jgi:soluble lytic murein transglycosylase-like protein